MTPETEEQREKRANELAVAQSSRDRQDAYTQGRRDADVDQWLQAHERRFKAINGSIEKTGTALTDLTEEVRQIKSDLKERDSVNEALVAAAAGQGATKLTRWQVAGIIVMGVMASGSLLVSIIQALGHSA
jgi:hypothetical protein